DCGLRCRYRRGRQRICDDRSRKQCARTAFGDRRGPDRLARRTICPGERGRPDPMKASAAQIRAAVDKPNLATRLFLLHGPDESGAADLAERRARALGPDVERVDIDMRMLREQPGRLADEAASLSLFGGVRYIRLLGADEGAAEAISLLLGAERAGNPVVAMAPGLKASGKLVKLAIAAPAALSHGCYVPEGIEATKL